MTPSSGALWVNEYLSGDDIADFVHKRFAVCVCYQDFGVLAEASLVQRDLGTDKGLIKAHVQNKTFEGLFLRFPF